MSNSDTEEFKKTTDKEKAEILKKTIEDEEEGNLEGARLIPRPPVGKPASTQKPAPTKNPK
jgi:hypothetical protein